MCVSKIWVQVICKDKDRVKDFNVLLLCAKNMPCHAQHLFQCVCSSGIVNMLTEKHTHSLYFWASTCPSDGDLECICWLVSAGIKILQMIQLKETLKILRPIRKCVCIQERVSSTEKPYHIAFRCILSKSCACLPACFFLLMKRKKKLHFPAHLRWCQESFVHTHKFLHLPFKIHLNNNDGSN